MKKSFFDEKHELHVDVGDSYPGTGILTFGDGTLPCLKMESTPIIVFHSQIKHKFQS